MEFENDKSRVLKYLAEADRKKNLQLQYDDKSIEVMTDFNYRNYLGVTPSRSGCFIVAIQKLFEKATMAIY